MKKLGEQAMSQKERTRKYYDGKDLVLFSARVERTLVDKLKEKLSAVGVSQRQFIIDAIKQFIGKK